MLRAFVSYQQDDWDLQLSSAEFACNNTHNASTGMSPFLMNHGCDPYNPYSAIKNMSDNIPAVTEFLCNDTRSVAKWLSGGTRSPATDAHRPPTLTPLPPTYETIRDTRVQQR